MELHEQEHGNVTVLCVEGTVDWESARRLDARIRSLQARGCGRLAVDLDRVSFLCSGGIGALAYNFNNIINAGGVCYVVSSNEHVNQLFETLQLDTVFKGLLYKTWDDLAAVLPQLHRPSET